MRWRFSVRTRRLLAVATAVGLVCTLSGCSAPDKAPIYEDQLGPESGETVAEYMARTPFARPGVTSWAMVTFVTPLPLADAAAFADRYPSQRVSQVVFSDRAPVTVPEAGPYATREELFHTYGKIAGADVAAGLVVFTDPDTLVAMHEDPTVLHVEVLPSDATWGFVGVRPVRVGE